MLIGVSSYSFAICPTNPTGQMAIISSILFVLAVATGLGKRKNGEASPSVQQAQVDREPDES